MYGNGYSNVTPCLKNHKGLKIAYKATPFFLSFSNKILEIIP